MADPQPRQEGVDVLRSVRGLQFEPVEDGVADRAGELGVERAGGRQQGPTVALERRHRDPSGGQPVQRGGQAVHVGRRSEAPFAPVLLERRVARRDHPGHADGLGLVVVTGQAEVDQHDAPVVGHHHVRRVQVTVQHPGGVHRTQSRRHPTGHVEHLGLVEGSVPLAEQVHERASFEQLHHQVGGAVLLEHLVDPDDARMGEAGQDPGLAQEALPGLLERGPTLGWSEDERAVANGRLGEQLLDRHPPSQPSVPGVVGDAEAPPTQQPQHLVAVPAQASSRRQFGGHRQRLSAPGAHQPGVTHLVTTTGATIGRLGPGFGHGVHGPVRLRPAPAPAGARPPDQPRASARMRPARWTAVTSAASAGRFTQIPSQPRSR